MADLNLSLDEQIARVLDGEDATTSETTFEKTSKKDYHVLKRYRNVTSYSILQTLHECPRKLLLDRHSSATRVDGSENIHFAFGHSVGAGVQNLWHSKNLETALFNSFLGWNISFDARIPKKRKSIWEAAIAVEKFLPFLEETLQEWELYYHSDGKPGIEIAFRLDCNNGYYYYGHIDVVLRNKVTGEIAVLEFKTTGLTAAEEAMYANSSQAIGYSLVLDAMFPSLSSYEVIHAVYSSPDREWTLMPFVKSTVLKAEWIKDTLLDQAMLEKYHEMQFYPKRGESCFKYFSRCEFFGACNNVPDEQLETYSPGMAIEEVDFELNLRDVINAQKARLA